MQTATFTTRAPVARSVRPARRSVTIQATARPEAPKQQKVALAALAAFAAAVLVNAAPVSAAEVKNTVCASNPTAKLCLRGSFQK